MWFSISVYNTLFIIFIEKSDMENKLKEIHELSLTIGVEAFQLTEIAQIVKTKFSKLVDDLKDYFKTPVTNEEAHQGVAVSKATAERQEKVRNFLKNHTMLTFKDYVIDVPIGFSGDLLKYAYELEQSVDYMLRVQSEIVDPFYVYVSSILSNKETRTVATDLTYDYVNNQKNRELLVDGLSKYFKRGGNSRVKLLSVVKNNKDLSDLFRIKNEIVSHLETYDFNGLNSKLAKISEVLEAIIRQSNNGKMTDISPEALTSMTKGVYEVAKQVEFVSLTAFSSMSFRETVTRLEHFFTSFKD